MHFIFHVLSNNIINEILLIWGEFWCDVFNCEILKARLLYNSYMRFSLKPTKISPRVKPSCHVDACSYSCLSKTLLDYRLD